MKSIALTATIFAVSGFLAVTSAEAFDASKSGGLADYSKGISGRCPAGTCNQMGGPNARDVKFCSAENCKRRGK
ncbi:hypothetical protein JQ628_02815 [Bradyrhizobium lablabi]|uniref:hypothetical protein n=1 Tax=Bradyrhizobium lablabi TaxID=722472 RepID=UPI001BA7F226|nr:hypothetical protein [Bradyrhizobium lablabi]MBR1120434.1 hypothetical protein [Bradyrhizobium lablabi]